MARRCFVVFSLVVLAVISCGRDGRGGCGCRTTREAAHNATERAEQVRAAREAAQAPHQWRYKTYKVPRGMLGRAVSPFDVYVDAAVVRIGAERWVTVLVQRGERWAVSSGHFSRERQLRPVCSDWQVRGDGGAIVREWLAGFVEDRDGTRHTMVGLPLEDLRHSYLVMQFEEVDPRYLGREDITLELDMTEYDWDSATENTLLDQALELPSVWE